ncbi:MULTISPECIES: acyl-CoA thioesterase domain-containing protein [unclassified Mycolicibacterium]|uniref:acyl-CoA thioesterase domain-containing protein n=1 Tax=unclassified Mycolicibacterium TaxID=2636767 RepID=UPI0012DDBC7B|nr:MULTISPECIES: acyl-CoA thioesterase domain-containing protein [unclassified Mycolicibacterium]MUL84683.1 thioesterase family protein [Mycolicibacterium sp. CBMA 329]MUL88458.1 thioesterase family protein [Mycolicibacterium sp. CBMA 331]MUM00203.1 thioesterase family protein [Mycolicibacterium sp. CBMA 334]MUM27865.1 thioesterase family protein [Mycolicibacterium sp. CBMA 295]MUM40105.1 thioesterase family protein [Mycolicibacterium sp. CBMA 247]
MIEVAAYFVQSEQDRFQPTRFAQSHWGEDHLNGPALVGLAAQALESAFGLPGFLPARLTVDLFKAARGLPTTTKVALIRDGRRVRNSECELVQDGVTVAHATLVQYRLSTPPRGEEWIAPTRFEPPAALDEDPSTYMGSDEGGWSRTIADHQNASRKRFMNRTITVVQGQPNSPFVRAAMAAEGTSLVTNLGSAGVGYINGDLTVALSRLPGDDWIGVQADSHWAADGIAVGASTLFDSAGAFGTGLVTAISNPAAQIDFNNDPFPDRTAPR